FISLYADAQILDFQRRSGHAVDSLPDDDGPKKAANCLPSLCRSPSGVSSTPPDKETGSMEVNYLCMCPSRAFPATRPCCGFRRRRSRVNLVRFRSVLVQVRTQRSEQLYQRALQHIAGGVNSPARSFDAVGGKHPIFMRRAQGAYFWDVDGNK